MYYINTVFAMAGYTGQANLLASSITYIINVFMTIPALIWMDKWGRRPTMLAGSLLMGIWMFTAAGILATKGEPVPPGGLDNDPSKSMKVSGSAAQGLVAVTYLFVASFAPTWGPVSWTYPPELFPLRLRSKGTAVATSGNWAFNTALGLFVPVAFEHIKWKAYIIFGVFNIAAFIHVALLFPETAGKTLEETEAIFEDPNGIKYLGTPAWRTKVATNATRDAEAGHIEAKRALDEKPKIEESQV